MVPVTPPMVTIAIGCAVKPSSLEAHIGGIATPPAWATITIEPECTLGGKALVLDGGFVLSSLPARETRAKARRIARNIAKPR